MSDGTPNEGAVERLVAGLTIGVHQAVRRKDKADRENGLREMDLQFQITFSGTASGVPAFEDITLNFDYGFFYAPSQRESNLEYPHFTYGSHTTPAVGVHATVKEWLKDETNGSIIGAVLSIGAVGEETDFKGVVHATFQGLGMLLEEDSVKLANEG